MPLPSNPSREHQALVGELIRRLEGNGCTIVGAVYGSYDLPGLFGGRRPDIVAEATDRTIIFGEAELDPVEHADQITGLARFRHPDGRRTHVAVVYPSSYRLRQRDVAAWAALERLGIELCAV